MPTPLISTLQASWLLNEANGNRLDPVNGNAMVPTGGVTQTPGVVGGGFGVALDGTGYLSAADSASLKCGPIDWTVFGWFNLTNPANASQQWIVSKRILGGAAEFDVSVASNGLILEILNGTDSSVLLEYPTVPGITVTPGWHFFVLRHVTATKEVTVFYDDKAVTRTYAGTITNSTAPFQLGTVNSGTGKMTGSLQSWGKSNRALTNQEIYYLYSKGAGKLYPFSDWTGTLAMTRLPKLICAGGHNAIGTDPDSQIGTNLSVTTQINFAAAYAAFNVRGVWANSIAGPVAGGESTNRLTSPIKIQATQFADIGASAIAEPFNGRTTLTLDVGQIGVGDDLGTNLAKGQLVRVRTLATLAAAGTMPGTTQTDWQVFNANHLADATNAGNGSDGQFHFSPFAVIGYLPADSGLVACAHRGDSIGPTYAPILAAAGGPYIDLSNSGEALTDVVTVGGDSTRTEFAAYLDVISSNYGVNDLRNGQTAAQMIANEIAFCRGLAAEGVRRFIRYTLTPLPAFSAADRNAFNAQIMAWTGTTFSAAIGFPVDYRAFDVNPAVETAPQSNTWVAGTSDDNVHPNATGQAAIRSLITANVVAAIQSPLPSFPLVGAVGINGKQTVAGDVITIDNAAAPIAAPISFYRIRRGPTSGGQTGIVLATIPAPGPFPPQTPPAAGSSWYYVAEAVDTAGNVSAVSNEYVSSGTAGAQKPVALAMNRGVPTGAFTVVTKDTYFAVDGRAFAFTAPAGAIWPASLAGWTITFTATISPENPQYGNPAFAQSIVAAGVVQYPTPPSQTAYVEFASPLLLSLAPGVGDCAYDFDIVATNGADRVCLARGKMNSVPNVTA